MGLSKAALSSLSCNACRRTIAHSFTASPSYTGLIPIAWRGSFQTSSSSASVQRRQFSSATILSVESSSPTIPETASLDQTAESTSTPTPAPDSSEASSDHILPVTSPPIPWYLQNRPLPTPQQAAVIPDLPLNPPPLLKELLEYISVTAGLDDLTLFDLRHLDPPPALGSKLIMVIGTARSEKHLHVSADRFCRHIRREYKLKANAAGLLGRNELKIKLRRKAKRMKMLANVGGAEPEGNIDDGIRTGWICCTIGKIEAHPEDNQIPGDNVQEFVGFRDVKPGVNVVVQMFTEEKRAETDLESLWNGVLKTHERKDKNAEEALKELIEEVDQVERDEVPVLDNKTKEAASKASPSNTSKFQRPRSTSGDAFPPLQDFSSRRQMRRLHTVGLRA